MQDNTAFSKYFSGAGHEEGEDGLVLKAPKRAPKGCKLLRRVSGHAPLRIFSNLDIHRCNLVQSGGFKVTNVHIWI